MSDSRDTVSVERFIASPPGPIFALIADPTRHREIDGSGTVRDAKQASQELKLGSSFGMAMKMGLPYSMVSTVVEYEKDALLAWQTRGPTAIGKLVGGRIWRYELEAEDGGTLVRETWDISRESLLTKPLVRQGGKATAKNMAATLDRIAEIVEA